MIRNAGRLLLALLDDAVSADVSLSGLNGKVAIGVVGDGSTLWWQATLGASTVASFVETPDDDGSWLLIGEREAEVMVQLGALPEHPSLLKIAGDRALLSAVVHRYLTPHSAVTLRTGGL